MKKKKILFVITKSNWGGAQRYVFDVASNLPKERFEVCVALGGTGAASASSGMLTKRLYEAGVRTLFIRSFKRDVSFGADVKSFFELQHLFREERPDVVHLNSSKAGGVGALAARAAGIHTIIFTAHGWPFEEKRNTLVRTAIWLASWLTALLCDRVIVVSDYDLRTARRMPFVGGKVIRIYNGIDLMMSLGSGDIVRNAFPKGVPIVGTIGELTKNKNQQTLIEKARSNPAMYVAIVGEGEEREALETQIRNSHLEERVKLFGFLPAEEALAGFDSFSLPSQKEGLPYVLLEARAAGLPIVANRVGGVGEILDAKDMGEFSRERMMEQTSALYQ